MSVLFENEDATLLSMENYLNSTTSLKVNSGLFEILSPYTCRSASRKKSGKPHLGELPQEVADICSKYARILPVLRHQGLVKALPESGLARNTRALNTADSVYEESGKCPIKEVSGCNSGPATIQTIQGSRYVFPEDCQFFCKDINMIGSVLDGRQFDLVLLDPPWWNKYIRRKRKKSHAYDMMYNCDLKAIPIESLLKDTGIVVVWCTNSAQHLNYLKDELFPKWHTKLLATWYWLKVTVHGEPVCAFSHPPGKQPFEQLLIGCKEKFAANVPEEKLLVSVPSAIHSHKPALVEVLRPFLPVQPECLELFARYLLPNWTSYGNEVLRFQHESLYVSG